LESHPNLNNLFGHFQFNNPEGVIMNSVDQSQNAINHGGSFEQIFNRDVGVLSLDSPQTGQNNYGSNENIDVTIANFGTSAIIEEFNVSYSLNGSEPVSVNIENSGWGIPANSTVELSFPNVDLSFSGVHHFQIYTSLEDDEYPGNDTLDVYIYQNNNTVGDITAFETSANSDTVTINNNLTEFRILFYTNDIFRIWMAPNGIFEDPAGTDIVVHNQPPIAIQTSDEGEYYKISSNSVILRVYKTPLTFAMYETDNTTVIWEESSPITFGEETRVVTAGRDLKNYAGAVNPPVYHVSTIISKSVAELKARSNRENDGDQIMAYGRRGTPTSWALENAVAELEGGYRTLAYPSGLAAIAGTLFAFLKSGDHLLMTDSVYAPTRRFCNQTLKRFSSLYCY
jgi:hypothetical protein